MKCNNSAALIFPKKKKKKKRRNKKRNVKLFGHVVRPSGFFVG
jgi:hypothetical protein